MFLAAAFYGVANNFSDKWFVPYHLRGTLKAGKNALDFTPRWP
jgi:hypothetical protein